MATPQPEVTPQRIACPACGASLGIPAQDGYVTCSFCDSILRVQARTAQPSGVEPDGTVRDPASGMGLFRLQAPAGWRVTGASAAQLSGSRPYAPQVELADGRGGTIRLQMGDAGTRKGQGQTLLGALGAFSGGAAVQAGDTTHYADMPDPVRLADALTQQNLANASAENLRSAGLATPLEPHELAALGQQALARCEQLAQAQGAAGMLSFGQPFGAAPTCVYAFELDGEPWKTATCVILRAAKWGGGAGLDQVAGQVSAFANQLGGMLEAATPTEGAGFYPARAIQASASTQGAGGLLKSAWEFGMGGGLIGKRLRERQAAQQAANEQVTAAGAQASASAHASAAMPTAPSAPEQPAPEQPVAAQPAAPAWASASPAAYVQAGTIEWDVPLIATLTAPASEFDTLYQQVFHPLVRSTTAHPDVVRAELRHVQQVAQGIQQGTQAQLAQSQAAFAAQQAAHARQQAAFQSYNDSLSAARDARQASFRAASNATFAGAAGTSGAARADFSEAIRGVNTYVTGDGRQVEVSVHATHAYENAAGDVIGTSGGNAPAGWTELPRT